MKNWQEEFQLVNLTKLLHSDTETSAAISNGQMIKLTHEVAINAEKYRSLPAWDKAAARAFAVGMTVDKAVVAGQSAARLWGYQTLTVEKTVLCLLPERLRSKSSKHWPSGMRYKDRYLSSRDIREVHGIRVTGAFRTFLDIALDDGVVAAVVTIDSARRQNPSLTREKLMHSAESFPRHRGVKAYRQAIELSIPNSDSAQETRARLILGEANLPEIQSVKVQARFDQSHNKYFLVDFLINEWIIVEIDGRSKYDSPELNEVLMAERDREKFFLNQGYAVLRIDPKQLDLNQDGECEFIGILKNTLQKTPPEHLKQAA
ncbi:hypothetical protein JJQ73_12675 [Corynebacterium glutamicum]|uniref:endonuclease domain-containing protein n=1 Tax=Corynebacterium glutamicum TaxID=1718 RepID=UPI001C6EB20F|nr:endonuclease domain-containing protein [Corynebacterium glutamicum]QYR17196.1 hypothetical protein JJQ73_12675 [Corynebacterium glutamicum]